MQCRASEKFVFLMSSCFDYDDGDRSRLCLVGNIFNQDNEQLLVDQSLVFCDKLREISKGGVLEVISY